MVAFDNRKIPLLLWLAGHDAGIGQRHVHALRQQNRDIAAPPAHVRRLFDMLPTGGGSAAKEIHSCKHAQS